MLRASISWLVVASAPMACGSPGGADDDQSGITIGFRASASDADETDGEIEIPIDLSDASDELTTLTCEITGGTATSADAFIAGCNIQLLAPGIYESSVLIAIAADDIPEPAETIELALTDATGARLGIARHTFTIRDNLLPRVTFAEPFLPWNEDSNNTATVEVQLMPASDQTVSVDYTIGGTATAEDYDVRAGTVVFPPGVTSQRIELQIVDETLQEDIETIVLTLTNPVNSIIGLYGTHTTRVGDNDPDPEASFTSSSTDAAEGNAGSTLVSVEVRLDVPSGLDLDVAFQILPVSTAVSPTDYVLQTSSPLNFPAGTTSRSITFEVVGDTVQDGTGTVVLQLFGGPNVSTDSTWHTLSFTNDECVGNGTFRFCPDVLPTGPVTLPMVVDTRELGSACLAQQPTGWLASGQAPACFVVGTTITIDTTVAHGPRPLVLYATDAIVVNGVLGARSPGSQPASCAGFGAAPGPVSGGAGGSFMTAGGDGGSHSGPAGTGGLGPPPVASPPLALRGGCAGQPGAGTDIFTGPGAGGGAVYLVAGNAITLQSGSVINASGWGGKSPGTGRGGSGGGSGGMIVLSAPTISANGSFLLANGGGGGEGGGTTGTGTDGGEPSATAPLTPAPGGTGGQGGDGGDGFARDFPAGTGASANNNNGGGGGGGGGGYIRSDSALTGAVVSPAPS